MAKLLSQLADQTFPTDEFEVVVVDDGSPPAAVARLRSLEAPFALTLVTQQNAGAGAARQAGGGIARGEVIVFLDDDMEIGPGFLAAHAALYAGGARVAVQGRIDADPAPGRPLFERYHAKRLAAAWAGHAGGAPMRGTHFCSGNLSVRRADFSEVGGFDPTLQRSEDADFGLRLERAGVQLLFANDARSVHCNGHGSTARWLQGARIYGATELAVARKHPWATHADPFRYLFQLGARSPAIAATALFPEATRAVAPALAWTARALDVAGLRSAAVHLTGLAYSTEVYRGMGEALGSKREVIGAFRRFLGKASRHPDPAAPVPRIFSAAERAVEDFGADLEASRAGDRKYGMRRERRIAPVVIERAGLQIVLGIRVMHFLRDAGFPLATRVVSRLMRHLYSCDIHWDAEIGPGFCVAHGMGLGIAAGSRVGPGCIMSHNCSLGLGKDAAGRRGAPTLEENVHMGPGAIIIGPITVGAGSKIMPNSVIDFAVPPRSIVEPAHADVHPRKPLAAVS